MIYNEDLTSHPGTIEIHSWRGALYTNTSTSSSIRIMTETALCSSSGSTRGMSYPRGYSLPDSSFLPVITPLSLLVQFFPWLSLIDLTRKPRSSHHQNFTALSIVLRVHHSSTPTVTCSHKFLRIKPDISDRSCCLVWPGMTVSKVGY